MKKIYLFLAMLLSCSVLMAQNEEQEFKSNDDYKTVFGKKSIGGYGAFGLGYTEIDGSAGVTFDARAAIVLGHSLSFGIGGVAFINEPNWMQAYNSDISLVGGYGGFTGELILFPRAPVHLSFPVLAGLGATGVASWIDNENISTVEEVAIFMIVEPSVELEFNLTRYFRLAAYVSYRFTSDLEFNEPYGTLNTALNAYSVGMRFKFGKF